MFYEVLMEKAAEKVDIYDPDYKRKAALRVAKAMSGVTAYETLLDRNRKIRQQRKEMNKVAEGNYYSRHLSEDMRNESFDEANRRRARRATGKKSEARSGMLIGGVLGGVGGIGVGSQPGMDPLAMGLIGAGAGAGLGYLAGRSGDKARDARTLEARQILEMSPQERAKVLKYRTAERLDDADEREEFHEDMRRAQKYQLRDEKIRDLRSRRLERTRRR